MRIAITGGIAEGKSTVLGFLAEFGESVLSADAVAREVVEDLAPQIVRDLNLELPLDRTALRGRISESAAHRRRLNQLTHPEIVRRLKNTEASFVEVPLLIEAALQAHFDEIWVVTCGPAIQRERLLARVQDPALVDRLLASQLPTRAKVAFADQVIRTNHSLASVREEVRERLGK